MSETVDIKINISSTNWGDRYPGARVYINETLIHEGLIEDPTEMSWSGDLADGDHKIVIEMYGKIPGDTVMDGDTIVNDVVLNIDSIAIDEIELDQLLWSNSEYFPKDENAPESMIECVNLGWNGRWELNFSSPVYLWFLENL
jgi:hypothetical protein